MPVTITLQDSLARQLEEQAGLRNVSLSSGPSRSCFASRKQPLLSRRKETGHGTRRRMPVVAI